MRLRRTILPAGRASKQRQVNRQRHPLGQSPSPARPFRSGAKLKPLRLSSRLCRRSHHQAHFRPLFQAGTCCCLYFCTLSVARAPAPAAWLATRAQRYPSALRGPSVHVRIGKCLSQARTYPPFASLMVAQNLSTWQRFWLPNIPQSLRLPGRPNLLGYNRPSTAISRIDGYKIHPSWREGEHSFSRLGLGA